MYYYKFIMLLVLSKFTSTGHCSDFTVYTHTHTVHAPASNLDLNFSTILASTGTVYMYFEVLLLAFRSKFS